MAGIGGVFRSVGLGVCIKLATDKGSTHKELGRGPYPVW